MDRRRFLALVPLLAVLSLLIVQGVGAQTKSAPRSLPAPTSRRARLEGSWGDGSGATGQLRYVTNADRKAAAARAELLRRALSAGGGTSSPALKSQSISATLTPGGVPDYFGTTPNYANSPTMRKFVDSLPGLGPTNANDLGQYIPVAVKNTTKYPGSDYYVIALVQYTEQMHKDLPPTTLRGYMQLDPNTETTLTAPSYLGPAIVADRNQPVRVKFINRLPTGSGGNLFLPVDTTVMGAGMGPLGVAASPMDYTQNRATLHLHGGLTPWISDGTPHQWTTPASESTPYQEGVSVKNVPDMDSGHEPTGTLTFYYTNQQSARLMFYHDHSFGITRLNVYAGEAAPYLLNDPVEQKLVNGGSFKDATDTTVTVAASTVPTDQVPLVIQDKSFVPTDTALAAQDPTWPFGGGHMGNLWFPHVYMPNQNPWDSSGINAMGRWDYNPWFYPPVAGQTFPPVANPLYPGTPGEPPLNPGIPNPTIIPEAFLDTPVVNGTAYPYLKVERKAYRFRILNACNDRYLNLQLYFAKSNTPDSVDGNGNPTLQTNSGEVSMTAAIPHPGDPTWPATWPTDGRDGGVPDPSVVGPSIIQIGNEGGLEPSATVLPNTPVGYEYFRRTITVLNVTNKTLYLGPAERADVIVDFSQVPNGSKIIFYNDAPAPMPAYDTRVDYYTGDPDQTSSGGAPTTVAGYGPNTRTVMQFQVESTTAASQFDVPALQTGLQAAYGATQGKPIVPEAAYGPAFGTTYPNTYAKVMDTALTFTPDGTTTPVTLNFAEKAIIEGFDLAYGRMNAQLGGSLPNVGPTAGLAAPYNYIDPPTEFIRNSAAATPIGTAADGTQIWRIDHQGVDTHAIHFHLFNVQVINRVALDGQVFLPDANELGWKETVRMNPGQDVFVALRPIAPTLPFKIPDSVRPLDPTSPLGATWNQGNQPNVPVPGAIPPATITNVLTNFGWEYVWHCHLLGHEENDMMRPIVFQVSPAAPTTLTATNLAATTGNPRVRLNWANNATNPAATNFFVQRSTNAAFTANVTTVTASVTGTTFTDSSGAPLTTYYYRVRAENAVSYSTWSNTATVKTTGILPAAPTSLTATAISNWRIRLHWTDNATNETAYYVERTVGGGSPWVRIKTLPANSTSYIDASALAHGRRYYYRVRCGNSAIGYSAYSNTASAVTHL